MRRLRAERGLRRWRLNGGGVLPSSKIHRVGSLEALHRMELLCCARLSTHTHAPRETLFGSEEQLSTHSV